MAANVDRFRKDFERLVRQGKGLDGAIQAEVWPKEFRTEVRKKLGAEKAEAVIKALPDFKADYEVWYSEALAVLKQVLPDRVSNFVGLYEKPKGRKALSYGTYVVQDYMQGLIRRDGFGETIVDPSAAVPQFRQQLAILKAAQKRFESSLFEIRQLVQADLFDSEIAVARELLKHKFLRAAGAVAGVVLEKHLRQVCNDHGIKVTKKSAGISDLNELLKAASVIEVPQWRHINLLGDLRNICVHEKRKEPTAEQVADLLNGTDKVLKTIA